MLSYIVVFPASTGECVINSNGILNFDNGTIREYKQRTDCYSIAVAHAAENSKFIVAVRRLNNDDDLLVLAILRSFICVTYFIILLGITCTYLRTTTVYQ